MFLLLICKCRSKYQLGSNNIKLTHLQELFFRNLCGKGLISKRITKSPYAVRIQENAGQKKLHIWTLFTQWIIIVRCKISSKTNIFCSLIRTLHTSGIQFTIILPWLVKFINFFRPILLRRALIFTNS